ncbi:MAG: NAD-dependent protein deacylase, partial [Oscillospiraceae bacterium]|nr:NAD-dependent protein deacylase [Oscillospiraceae bacterium]
GPAHYALAKLEAMGKLRNVITQNIDGLHTLAGSKKVIELHGSVMRNYCIACHREYPLSYIMSTEQLPLCDCGGLIRPDVVLYEEPLDENSVALAIDAISSCQTLIVAGSSLRVYPAAGLLGYYNRKQLIIINLTATDYDHKADMVIRGKVGEVLIEIIGYIE